MGKTRTATLRDVPAVIDVILASVHNERLWASFTPHRSGNSADYRQEIEALLEEHIDPSNGNWVIEVVDQGGKGSDPVIVSVAIWDMSAAEGHGGHARRETKMPIEDSLLNNFYDLVQNGRGQFVKRYPQFMYLQLIATHPNHRGQGYAKDLMQAYITKSKQKGCTLATFGGPFGYIFFSGLGFQDLGLVTMPSNIVDDTAVVKAMSLVVPKENRRRAIVGAVLSYIAH